MIQILAPFALLAAAQTSTAPPPPVVVPTLTLEQSTALKCGVGFAIVDRLHKDGGTAAAQYPALGERGREFFVRSAAKLMDETGAGREAIAVLAAAQSAELLAKPEQLEAMMPACLLLLKASGI